ncbi:hypothetical protein [Mariniblastus fucicola]|uniref:Uncharacterized protein n=1 Tax=Mariniblastus fucicola TaxID=980251 RepID=A0A5B9P9J0_9BACT|nr:hypothetical protein [Mariniblastus fucicola]QEG21612.1 hypothetical protein MFFC18_14700 [Mariniblastus fucicola]
MDKLANQKRPKFTSKKGAKESGYFTGGQWFKKYRAPRRGENGIEFRGEHYFRDSQTEELFSRSKGTKLIGALKPGAQPVGQKRFRRVKFLVYRESDFNFEPKVVRKISPAKNVNLIDAIAKTTETANKFTLAARNSAERENHKRARGFRSRARKLFELADIGLRKGIVMEVVSYRGKRGGVHRYSAEGHEFRSRVAPPTWFDTKANSIREPKAGYRSRVRLMDATYTLEQLKDDPTLQW